MSAKNKKDYKLGEKFQGDYKGKSLSGKVKEVLETAGKQTKGSAKEILSSIKSLATPMGPTLTALNKLRNRPKKANFQKGDYSDIKIVGDKKKVYANAYNKKKI